MTFYQRNFRRKPLSRHFLEDIFVRYHAFLLRPWAEAFPRALKPGFPKINADRFPDNVALVPPLALREPVEFTGHLVWQTD